MSSYDFIRIIEALTWIGFFTVMFLSYYFYLKFRNKERMGLIEKGVDVSELFKGRDVIIRFPWIRIGILLLSVGVGVLFSYLIIVFMPPRGNQDHFGKMILIFSLLIFGGVGIIIGDVFERYRNRKNG